MCNADEPVNFFVAHLKQQAAHCDFKATLEDRLNDQMVWGNSVMKQLQKRL